MKKIVLFILLAIAIPLAANAQVVIENFRNFDCTNCKVPDEAFEAFLKKHPEYNAQIIYYHNGTPYPNDPFYQAAKEGVDYRNKTLYNTQGNPTVYVNGIFAGQGENSYDNWESLTTDAAAITGHPTLDLTNSNNGDGTYTITLTMNGSTSQEVRPYIMILESGIVQANPWGYKVPTSGVWDNVFRSTVPVPQGGDPFVLQGSKTLSYQFDPRGKIWNVPNLRAVAFLQNVNASIGNSREIVGIKSTATGFFEPASVEGEDVLRSGRAYPNPFSESVQIPVSLREPAHVTIKISDLLGREVATLIDQKVTEQRSSVTFTPQSLAAGTYVASLYVNGSLAAAQKLVYHP